MWSSSVPNPPASQKPYLLRAIYEWLENEQRVGHLVVARPAQSTTGLPAQLLNEEHVVLNISSTATGHLKIGDDFISFSARFGGQPHQVSVAVAAVIALVDRESNEGIAFALADNWQEELERNKPKANPFRIVK